MDNAEIMSLENAEIKTSSNHIQKDRIILLSEIIRDATRFYRWKITHGIFDKKAYESYPTICARADYANTWLKEHGYREEPFNYQ